MADVIIFIANDILSDSLKEAIIKISQISCKHLFGSEESALNIIEKEELVPYINLFIIVLPG